ncbi:uncharacterized protein [Dendropsophus ebraccatus]|uniref:uncharacterized protein n=1 Tax=Dendropsophus ebraccatus TaxID=150705 RepID=UPI0038319CDA
MTAGTASSGSTAAGVSSQGQPGRVPLAWIFGHSFVVQGARRADVRSDGRQLRFHKSDLLVRWIGLPGLLWGRVLPELEYFASMDRYPDILVLHVGGNDFGVRRSRDIIRDIKLDLLRLWVMAPETLVVWSDVVAWRTWRFARSVEWINRARAKLNKEVGRFVRRNGGIVVRHRDLEGASPELMDSDGVHLNDVGMDLWMLGLHGGLEMALQVWRDEQR